MVSNKTSINNSSINEEFKDQPLKHNLSKFDYDLYHEEDDIPLPIIRVKYFKLPNNGERWKIFKDNIVIFVLEGSKINKKEKNFLKTPDGVNFLIYLAKQTIKNISWLKKEINKKINS